jgi:hypothetical protein
MTLLEWDHPEASARAFVATDTSAATIHDGASDLGEGDGTAGVDNARPGMMWALLAAAGSSGRSRVQVCVDWTLSPFGRRATRGTVAAQIFVAGALVVRKWLVAPESRIAHCLMVSALVEIVLRSTVTAKA